MAKTIDRIIGVLVIISFLLMIAIFAENGLGPPKALSILEFYSLISVIFTPFLLYLALRASQRSVEIAENVYKSTEMTNYLSLLPFLQVEDYNIRTYEGGAVVDLFIKNTGKTKGINCWIGTNLCSRTASMTNFSIESARETLQVEALMPGETVKVGFYCPLLGSDIPDIPPEPEYEFLAILIEWQDYKLEKHETRYYFQLRAGPQITSLRYGQLFLTEDRRSPPS